MNLVKKKYKRKTPIKPEANHRYYSKWYTKSKNRMRTIFNQIKHRCANPKNPYFKNYGGRGIKCLWKDFEEFYNDMGDRMYTYGQLSEMSGVNLATIWQRINKRNWPVDKALINKPYGYRKIIQR